MSRDPARIGSDIGAPLHNVLLSIKFDGGEEVVLTAIDPVSGYQRSG